MKLNFRKGIRRLSRKELLNKIDTLERKLMCADQIMKNYEQMDKNSNEIIALQDKIIKALDKEIAEIKRIYDIGSNKGKEDKQNSKGDGE